MSESPSQPRHRNPMNTDQIQSALAKLSGWELVEEDGMNRLRKNFRFKNFEQALQFTNRVGALAEEYDHHPAILTEWGSVTLTWWTHSAGGVTQSDIDMAARVDRL